MNSPNGPSRRVDLYSILPSITEYIRIPNKSPAYDPQWVEHGYMENAVTLMEGWARPQLDGLPGATLEVDAPAYPRRQVLLTLAGLLLALLFASLDGTIVGTASMPSG